MSSQKPFVIDLKNDNEYQPLLQGRPQSCGMRAGRVSLLPGQDCGWHSTNSHEELLVFVAGEGEVIFEKDTALRVGAGRMSYIPPNTAHNVRNTGNEPLTYVYCVASANPNQERANEQS